jgi:hypothetical protein
MTRNDFEVIADVLHEALEDSLDQNDRDMLAHVSATFCRRLKLINPRFDRKKFEAVVFRTIEVPEEGYEDEGPVGDGEREEYLNDRYAERNYRD